MKDPSKPMTFSKNLAENEAILTERLGLEKSFDVGVRKLKIFNKEIQIYYLTGLVDNLYIIEILRELMETESRLRRAEDPFFSR